MASVLAQLKAVVTADAKAFKAGMSDAQRSVSSFQKSVSAVGNYIAGAFSVGAIVAYAKSVISWAGSLSDAAKNAGVLTSEMMAFNNVALQSGVGIDKMQNMLIKMQDQLDAAANGDEKATAAFQRLGLSIDDLIGMTPAQMLVEIAKASTTTGASISALADIFGMRLGPTARAALADIANGLPEIDKAAADAVDALDANADRWEAIWDRMKVPAAEGLNWIGNKLENWQGAFAGGIDALMREYEKLKGIDTGEGTSLDPMAILKGQVRGWKDSTSNRDQELEEKRKKAAAAANAAEDQRKKALDDKRQNEIDAAKKTNDELLRARLDGIEKIKDEANRAEDEINEKLKSANGVVKELLNQRLQIVRENAQKQIDEILSAEDKKAQAEFNSVFSDKEGAVSDILRLGERQKSAADGIKGDPLQADSISRMGGFVGGYRPEFAASDRRIRLQEENNRYASEMVKLLERLNELNQRLVDMDVTNGGSED